MAAAPGVSKQLRALFAAESHLDAGASADEHVRIVAQRQRRELVAYTRLAHAALADGTRKNGGAECASRAAA